MKTKIIASVLLLELLASNLLVASDIKSSTHCNASENIIFSCDTGKKIMSICASKNIGAKTGYIQYRFGKIGSPEIILPSTPENFRSTVSAYSYTGASYNSGVIFKNQDISYNIDSRSASLEVTKKGKSIAELTCRENSDGTRTAIDNIDTDKLKKWGVKVEE